MTTDEILAELDHRRREGVPFDALLAGVIERLHESNEKYDWTGIYELFPDGTLRLGPFVGAPTEHVFIGVGRGVCGTAVAEKRNLNIPDVREAENYLACSQATRSELVVLIRNEDRIYAQVDIDSHQLAAFDEQAVTDVERIADALAELYALREEYSATETVSA